MRWARSCSRRAGGTPRAGDVRALRARRVRQRRDQRGLEAMAASGPDRAPVRPAARPPRGVPPLRRSRRRPRIWPTAAPCRASSRSSRRPTCARRTPMPSPTCSTRTCRRPGSTSTSTRTCSAIPGSCSPAARCARWARTATEHRARASATRSWAATSSSRWISSWSPPTWCRRRSTPRGRSGSSTSRAGTCRRPRSATPTPTSSAFPTRRGGRASTRRAPCARRWTCRRRARDGRAAALKAMQSIEKSGAGQAVHPRVGDLTLPRLLHAEVHLVRPLHPGVPVRRARAQREEEPRAQPQPLPALRDLHGRLPGADHLVRRLLGGHALLHDPGGGDPRGRRGQAAHPGAGLRERRLPGAGHGGAQARSRIRPRCA